MSEEIKRMPSENPPAGLKAENVPQLVSFTFDDNSYSGLPESGAEGGMKFITDSLTSRRNPAGNNAGCFDGTQIAGTFYIKGDNGCENPFEDVSLVKKAWRLAYDKGCELGAHTYSHPHGLEFDFDSEPAKRTPIIDVEGWTDEINRCIDVLTNPRHGIEIDRNRIVGFRTPYIEFNNDTFTALQNLGFKYDASVEEGWQDSSDGTNYLWPYTLDNGCECDKWVSAEDYGSEPLVKSHPGLWCLPNYTIIVPPDEKCAEYGTLPGARERMKQAEDSFDEKTGKITGIDWNIWFEFFMSPEDALASLKYSFDLRYNGNRCPWPIAFHSDIYSDKYDENNLDKEERAKIKADARQRRQTFISFLDYLLTKPDVRIVTSENILKWLKNPEPLRS